MSSMRNAVTRRPHKERAQPASRAKWGILEKHKDYSLRAKDYNLKKQKLTQLERKARDRNPDEFAFGMLSKTQGKTEGTEERLSVEAVKLLKSQDQGYLKVVAGQARREVKRLGEQVVLGEVMRGEGAVGKRTVFEEEIDGSETVRGKKRRASGEVKEQDATTPDIADDNTTPFPASHGDDVEMSDADENTHPQTPATVAVTATKKPPPPTTKAALKAQAALKERQAERKRRKRLADLRATKLEALRKRQREILAAADALELQRAKMAHTVGGVNKNGVKFKIRERRK